MVGTSGPDEGAERNPVPHRRDGVAFSGRRTDEGTTGHIASDGGSIKHNGQAAAARTLGAARATGDVPLEPRAPWRDDSRLLGRHLAPLLAEHHRWNRRRRRAGTGLAANAGDDAPQPPHLNAAPMASWATRSTAAAPRDFSDSIARGDGSPITTELKTPVPGRLARPRRAVECACCANSRSWHERPWGGGGVGAGTSHVALAAYRAAWGLGCLLPDRRQVLRGSADLPIRRSPTCTTAT